MGIFHSTTTRFMALKPLDEEEGERQAYPNLQNQYQSYGDSSLKILVCSSSIYKATKCLLQKLCLVVFNFLSPIKTATKCLLRKLCLVFKFFRPRKTTDPLLPIRNPASTALCQPLLLPSQTDLDGIHVENTCHVSCCQEWKEDRYSADCELVQSTPQIRCSNADEIEASALVKAKKNKKRKQKNKKPEAAAVDKMERWIKSPCFVEGSMGGNSRDEEREEDLKNIIGVDEKERRIKHYKSSHKILLVGEGDFSFSACLALAFVSAPNIIATSLNSIAFLQKHYGKAMSNIAELRSRGSMVMHEIDATDIANHELLRQFKFDRIVFNFPFAGFFHKLSTEDQLRRHRRLVSLFLKNAKELISENGEIHISHKTNGLHADFKLESIASSHGLRLIQAVKFKLSHYPGYDTKFGFGGDGNFNCYPSKTFKFALK